MILLSNRELQEAALQETPGVTIINTADLRTNEPISNQVAAIWVGDEGEPPEFNGVWLNGKEGRVVEYEKPEGNPNIDPAVFPLLFPKGTQGHRWGLKKNMRKDKAPSSKDQAKMDAILDASDEADFMDDVFALGTCYNTTDAVNQVMNDISHVMNNVNLYT
jgi:hypothetical protein